MIFASQFYYEVIYCIFDCLLVVFIDLYIQINAGSIYFIVVNMSVVQTLKYTIHSSFTLHDYLRHHVADLLPK